ncbi:MAG: hypothetical protein DWQ01_11155 [Planctomycetota bacterium]|nr:MAG: hypothetical protein DWQ01_11155 [Planctomycetota bacterium]
MNFASFSLATGALVVSTFVWWSFLEPRPESPSSAPITRSQQPKFKSVKELRFEVLEAEFGRAIPGAEIKLLRDRGPSYQEWSPDSLEQNYEVLATVATEPDGKAQMKCQVRGFWSQLAFLVRAKGRRPCLRFEPYLDDSPASYRFDMTAASEELIQVTDSRGRLWENTELWLRYSGGFWEPAVSGSHGMFELNDPPLPVRYTPELEVLVRVNEHLWRAARPVHQPESSKTRFEVEPKSTQLRIQVGTLPKGTEPIWFRARHYAAEKWPPLVGFLETEEDYWNEFQFSEGGKDMDRTVLVDRGILKDPSEIGLQIELLPGRVRLWTPVKQEKVHLSLDGLCFFRVKLGGFAREAKKTVWEVKLQPESETWRSSISVPLTLSFREWENVLLPYGTYQFVLHQSRFEITDCPEPIPLATKRLVIDQPQMEFIWKP